MNKWKMTFIFLTGFWLHEFLTHLWISGEGLLPFTSRLFGIILTPEMNTFALALNGALLLIFGYFGFRHRWNRASHVERHA